MHMNVFVATTTENMDKMRVHVIRNVKVMLPKYVEVPQGTAFTLVSLAFVH